jgi:hypothetical protein
MSRPRGGGAKGLWMPNFLSQLTKTEQARLLEELNYMNLKEIRGFCSERGIPYRIVAEYSKGKAKATKDTDRKPIVLARVRRYLTTGQVGQPTCIPAEIVRKEILPRGLDLETASTIVGKRRSSMMSCDCSGI